MMKNIFTPTQLKTLTLKNRICVPPMITPFSQPHTGLVVEETVQHYQRLALGQAGLIIVEATAINLNGRLGVRQLGLWNDEQIEGHQNLVHAVHKAGAPVLVQIHHTGIVGIEEEAYCPSAYTYTRADGREKTGIEMTLEDVQAIQEDFISAAVRAYKAGYDGIELHGCHNYLLCQFMNRKVNTRTDAYGQDRTLFVREIITQIRKQTPASWIVGIRLGGFEPTLEDAIVNAQQLEASGIDFFDVSYGFRREQETTLPQGYPYWDIIYAAEQIKAAVSVPVFAANGITSPEMAENILNDTKVDMIDIGRGFMVNFDWAKDAMAGLETGQCLRCKVCMLYTEPERCPGRILTAKRKRSVK